MSRLLEKSRRNRKKTHQNEKKKKLKELHKTQAMSKESQNLHGNQDQPKIQRRQSAMESYLEFKMAKKKERGLGFLRVFILSFIPLFSSSDGGEREGRRTERRRGAARGRWGGRGQ